jgi:hypothetical protein
MSNKYLHWLFLGILLFPRTLQAQTATGSPYMDAIEFSKALTPGADVKSLEKLVNIVSFYADRKDININNISTVLGTMPFLKEYVPFLPAIAPAATAKGSVGAPTSSPGGIAGLDVTNISDGIAKFLIERGRQELSMAFFDRFKKDLERYPELKVLFAESSLILMNIESYNIQNLLQELKDAFMKDLLNIPNNILALRSLTKESCKGDTRCEERINSLISTFTSSRGHDTRLFILPLICMQGVIDGNNIIDITNKMSADSAICATNDNFNSIIKLSSILLESLRNPNTDGGLFLNQAGVRNLFYSRDLLNIFLGLIYQKYKAPGLNCYAGLTIGTKNMEDIFTLIINSRVSFYATLTSLDKINAAYASIQRSIRDNQKVDAASYASAIMASISMLDNISRSLEILIPKSLPENYTRFASNLKIAGNICLDIQNKNYAGIFNGTIKFINDNAIANDETRERLVKYLSFAANLSSAKTSDEVKEALNAVALPPGSYSIKQRSAFNISLNGYVGYNWDFNGGLYANGVYAPVGFSASCGLGRKHGGALTLFAAVIDVGALVAYRLQNGVTDDLKQDIRLESILAPSAQLFIGIPKTPIAAGIGWRRTAKLFYSADESFTVIKPKSVFSASILIDIPIFTLKNNAYK